MAEHTYKSNDLTAVIDWDINQITSADEGKIIADLNVYAVSYTHLTLPTICSV